MNLYIAISSILTLGLHIVESYPGEIIYGCAPAEKEWEGEYTPWAGNTKNAHAHLTFDDGPFPGITDVILDVLKEKDNTPATFFLQANRLNKDTRYLVDRMIEEGHTIGSHTTSHRNLQYGNATVLHEEIVDAHETFIDFLGYAPKIFRPPYGGIDTRSHALLEELDYTIVSWSAGCNDWYFTDNDKDLETSIAALRYTLAEMGGIICMHDKAQAGVPVDKDDGADDGKRLKKMLDDTWNFWQYVDFHTCIDRDDVDEGMVFKTYNEYQRAVDKAAKNGGDDSKLLFSKSSKSSKSKSSKGSKASDASDRAKRHLRHTTA